MPLHESPSAVGNGSSRPKPELAKADKDRRAGKSSASADFFRNVTSIETMTTSTPHSDARRLLSIVSLTLLSLSCSWALSQEAQGGTCSVQTGVVPSGKAALGSWGFETQFIDNSVKPGDDFYRYANGIWLKQTPMPSGRAVWGMFDDVQQRTAKQIETIIATPPTGRGQEADTQRKVQALYTGYTNTAAMDRTGPAAIDLEKRRLAGLKTLAQITQYMAEPSQASLVSIAVTPDPSDHSRLRVGLIQGSLGLPGRDYYLKQEEPFGGYRKAYREYIASTLRQGGIANPDAQANALLELETSLASAEWTQQELRDSARNNHSLSLAQLQLYAPGIDWHVFLAPRHVDHETMYVLQSDTALQSTARIFAATRVETWRTYLLFRWIVNHASVLQTSVWDRKFAFFSGTLQGVKTQRPRQDLAVDYVNLRMGDAIGHLYVERYFSEASRAKISELVADLRAAFAERLEQADWLDAETRLQAQRKLNALTVRLGYPSDWRDYTGVSLQANDPVRNQDRLAEADWEHAREGLTKGISAADWFQSPQTIDATSSKFFNSIEFPAGILQPPFFDPNADPAVNFGAIGAIIGHEMGHNFDDQGSQFDETGKQRDWWTQETRRSFTHRTGRLVDQYDGYSSVPGMHVNGKQTIGENIGDLTGVVVAHAAYIKYMKAKCNGTAPVLDGFTGEQRFFLAWAQVWRCLFTPEAARSELLQGYHAPAEFRVNGVLRNVDAWYAAFNVQGDNSLYLKPTERVLLW